MTEWTAERLEALPDGTLFELGGKDFLKIDGNLFQDLYGQEWTVSELPSGSLRVVSVPIDALLSDGAVHAAQWASGWNFGMAKALRAAIAHVTGGQP